MEFKSGFIGYLNKHHLNWERTKILTKTKLQVDDIIEVKVIKFKPIASKYILSHRILIPKPISKKKKRKLSKRGTVHDFVNRKHPSKDKLDSSGFLFAHHSFLNHPYFRPSELGFGSENLLEILPKVLSKL